MNESTSRCSALLAGIAAMLALAPACSRGQAYVQTNLVSNLPGVAKTQDPTGNLDNPWGITSSPTSPFWVSDNDTGKATLYSGTGAILGLVVTVPLPPTPPPLRSDINPLAAAPTGQVFNTFGSSAFAGSSFIFDTEDGTISSWSGGPSAVPRVNNSQSPDATDGAVYKGLAIGNTTANPQLFATNFRSGNVDVFNSTFGAVGSFHDPTIPAGFAPFNIDDLGGTIYVTYAEQDAAKHDDVAGLGNGFVDTFNPTTDTFNRLISGGLLDSPWGLAIAPSNFGIFSNDLLVGNFGNGEINAYDPTTGAFIGTFDSVTGDPIIIPGLWGLDFGNGHSAGPTNTLYFTAGLGDPPTFTTNIEANGLFGSLQAVPEPGNAACLLALVSVGTLLVRRRR